MSFQSGLLTAIEGELRTLSLLNRKKVPELVNAAERAVLRLRQLESRGLDEKHDTMHSDVILRPFLLSCSTKQPKLVMSGLNGIHKLLSLQPIAESFLCTVIGALRIQAESTDNKVQLKILQALLLAVSPSALADKQHLSEGAILQGLGICFRLRSHSDPIIHNTASVALSQLVNLVFDRISQEYADRMTTQQIIDASKESTENKGYSPVNMEEMDSATRNAFFLFRDLCFVAKGDALTKPRWLNVNSVIPVSVGIELVEDITKKYTVLLYKQAAFQHLLANEVCPLLIKLLRSADDFPHFLRVIRCVIVLVKQYNIPLVTECEILIVLLVKMIDVSDTVPLWKNVLLLEALYTFCSSDRLVYFFYDSYDSHAQTTNVFQAMCTALMTVVTELVPKVIKSHEAAHQKKQSHQMNLIQQTASIGKHRTIEALKTNPEWKLGTKRKGLDLLNETEPPAYEETYAVGLATDCLVKIVKAVSKLATPLLETSSHADSLLLQSPKRKRRETSDADAKHMALAESLAPAPVITLEKCRDIARTSHSCILAGMSMMLTHNNDEQDVQYLLMAYQSFTNICGLLTLPDIRDELITSLCSFALPPDAKNITDNLSVLAVKFRREVRRKVRQPEKNGLPSPVSTTYKLRALLSTKNLQSLRALFNIAHCLGSILEESWSKVLDTFEQLDNIIQVSGRIRDRLARNKNLEEKYSPLLADASELDVMSVALARLFESTVYMNDTAIAHVLKALGTLSVEALNNAQDADIKVSDQVARETPNKYKENGILTLVRPSGRMFALINLILVIEHNIHRVGTTKVWDTAIEHLELVMLHSNPVLRKFGVSALTRLAQLALMQSDDSILPQMATDSKLPSGGLAQTPLLRRDSSLMAQSEEQTNKSTAKSNTSTSLGNISEEKSSSKTSDGVDLQDLVLEPFHRMYISKFSDNKINVLAGIFAIVENSGDVLESGWSQVLKILRLAAVPENTPANSVETKEEEDLVSSGFKCINLIMNTFLECVPLTEMEKLTLTIGFYCMQKDDSNISFTSIQFLWSVADYLAKREATADDNSVNELFVIACSQLESCCLDTRCEVRNSAVKTLHSILVSLGPLMQPDTCFRCLTDLTLPLLSRLLAAHEEVEQKVEKGMLLGVDKSRDTATKQWNETRVFAIRGTTRVVGAYMKRLSALEKFKKAWSEYLDTVLTVLSNPLSDQLGVTMISSFYDLLTSESGLAVLQDSSNGTWSQVVPLMLNGLSLMINVINKDKLSANLWMENVTCIMDYIGKIANHEVLCTLITSSEITGVLRVTQDLLLLSDDDYDENPFSKAKRDMISKRNSVKGLKAKRETPLQAAVLRFLEIYFTSGNDTSEVPRELYPVLFNQLIKYLTGGRSLMELPAFLKGSATFVMQTLPVLTTIFQNAPEDVCFANFEQLLRALSSLLHVTSRDMTNLHPLCAQSVENLTAIVARGLQCAENLGKTYAATESTWRVLYDIFSSFLYGQLDASDASVPASPLTRAVTDEDLVFERSFSGALAQQREEKEAEAMLLMEAQDDDPVDDGDVSESTQLMFVTLQVKMVNCITVTLMSRAICDTPRAFQERVVRLLDMGSALRLSSVDRTPLPSPIFVPTIQTEAFRRLSAAVRQQMAEACLRAMFTLCHCKAETRIGATKGNEDGKASERERMYSEPDVTNTSSPQHNSSYVATPQGKTGGLASLFISTPLMSSPKYTSPVRSTQRRSSTSDDALTLEPCRFCNVYIAAMVAPLLMVHWEMLLRNFTGVDGVSGDKTPHRKKSVTEYHPVTNEEVLLLFDEMARLETHPEVSALLMRAPPISAQSRRGSVTRSGSFSTPTTSSMANRRLSHMSPGFAVSPLLASVSRGHLLRLFPLLCECIDVDDKSVRLAVKNLLLLASSELGLTPTL